VADKVGILPHLFVQTKPAVGAADDRCVPVFNISPINR
jgi:hypothetical protein